jgi:hypothetical protein
MRNVLTVFFLAVAPSLAIAQTPVVTAVERQPLEAATRRLIEALEYSGRPLLATEKTALEDVMRAKENIDAIKGIQAVLDPLCVVAVNINAESRVKVAEGSAPKRLSQGTWTTFLVKVHNEAGITPRLVATSPNAAPVYMKGKGPRQQPMKDAKLVRPDQVSDRFLDISMNDREPLKKKLSGLGLEYRIIQLQSRDAGKREASLAFNVGQGTQDIGFRNSIPILFDCAPAVEIKLGIKDQDNSPVMASLIIRDKSGTVFPNPARRLAPDFFFHSQVYRADGESVLLPPGDYTATIQRGPEYIVQKQSFTVSESGPKQIDFRLKRWTHPARRS